MASQRGDQVQDSVPQTRPDCRLLVFTGATRARGCCLLTLLAPRAALRGRQAACSFVCPLQAAPFCVRTALVFYLSVVAALSRFILSPVPPRLQLLPLVAVASHDLVLL